MFSFFFPIHIHFYLFVSALRFLNAPKRSVFIIIVINCYENMDKNRCNVSQHDSNRGMKSFSLLCWMLCIMGQKVSTKSLMAILSDCFPSSSCLLYANIGNNSNIRIKGERNGCHSRLGDHFLSQDPLHTTKETETLDACMLTTMHWPNGEQTSLDDLGR